MIERDVARMLSFRDIGENAIKLNQAPALIVTATQELCSSNIELLNPVSRDQTDPWSGKPEVTDLVTSTKP